MSFGTSGMSLVLLLVIFVIAILMANRGAGGMFMASARRARPRHLATRIFCGVLGLSIPVAIAIGTWNQTQRAYLLPETGSGLKVRIPTKAVARPQGVGQFGIKQARLLIHLVAVEASSAALRPLQVKEFDVRWPQEKGPFGAEFDLQVQKLHYTFTIDKVYYSNQNTIRVPPEE